jgi:2-polyprenyl-3-methyl-5-hydroxy-6-metoxy-1,4-benzoquinol methylase
MTLILHKNCPVCQSTALQNFVTCQDYTVSAEVYELVKCEQCQTVITQNTPDEQNIGRYYQAESYISHSNTRKGLVNTLYHYVRDYMLGRKKLLVEQLSGGKQGKLLDIGCGTGYFLATMQKAGWQVQGIEADEKARNFAQQTFQLEVKLPNEIENLPANTFDIISLWHVLEHLHDLHGYMSQIKRVLKTKGTLLIAVPNYVSYDAKHYGNHWAAYDVPRHLWHFCPTAMATLAQKHNLQITHHYIMPFDSFYVALLSEKYKKNPLSLLAGFWHGLLSLLGAWQNPKKSSAIIYVLTVA